MYVFYSYSFVHIYNSLFVVTVIVPLILVCKGIPLHSKKFYNYFSDTSILFLEMSKHGCEDMSQYHHKLHWSFPDPALFAGCCSLLGFLLQTVT